MDNHNSELVKMVRGACVAKPLLDDEDLPRQKETCRALISVVPKIPVPIDVSNKLEAANDSSATYAALGWIPRR